jgi:hypothetical protein
MATAADAAVEEHRLSPASNSSIRRAAIIWFGGFVASLVAFPAATLTQFAVPWIASVASVVSILATIPLIVALRRTVPSSGHRSNAVFAAGIGSVVCGLIGTLAGDVGWSPVRDVVGAAAGLLDGLWFIGIGAWSLGLPRPLPRRAILGGVGSMIYVVELLLTSGKTESPLFFVAAVLLLFGLAFVLGLIRATSRQDQSTVPDPVGAP